MTRSNLFSSLALSALNRPGRDSGGSVRGEQFIRMLALLSTLLFAPSCADADPGRVSDRELFRSMDSVTYLRGDFDPAQEKGFVELGQVGVPHRGRQILRKEAASALKELYNDFHREHPDVSFRVISSTRNFHHQKAIWEAKWNGRRKVDGKQLNRSIADPVRRARKILEYSSMPGTSRHHWGTDFDINALTNGYFESGEGQIVFSWLEKNAYRYGFCRPYTAGRQQGYNEEKWHWSYKPLARPMTQKWLALYRKRPDAFFPEKAFDGSNIADRFATIYVAQIAADCME